MVRRIKVLVVDDSAIARKMISEGLASDPGIEVVSTAADAYIARDKIIQYKPDVMTLDIEMPKMNGVEFLRKLMPQYPIPVVIVSGVGEHDETITLDALDAGAVDFVAKPSGAGELNSMLLELQTKIKIASTANVSHWKAKKKDIIPPKPQIKESAMGMALSSDDIVIAIGASTGGTEAIRKVISALPPSSPGVLIVQHMPSGFTSTFAQRMNSLSSIEVKEAANGDEIKAGRALIAPGDLHMSVFREKDSFRVTCKNGEKVNGHRPSVDVMMKSVAANFGANAIGIMLTGMGSDGADGMAAMTKMGARALAQDEKSSVVFGMPKVAYERGGAEMLVPVDDIAGIVIKWAKEIISNKAKQKK